MPTNPGDFHYNWMKNNDGEWILEMKEKQLAEEKAPDAMKEETQTLTFREAMGSSYEKIELDNDTVTLTVTEPDIEITSGVVMSDSVEMAGTVEYDGGDLQVISWDYPEDYSLNFEIDFSQELNLGWKFNLLDEGDEKSGKTAPKSLTNNFEDNRDPRLGTLAQKESD